MFRIRTLSALFGLWALVVAGAAVAETTEATETATEAVEAPATESSASPPSSSLRDGRLFDPGVTMSAPAEGAPDELANLVPYLGEWDVAMTVTRPGQDGPTVLESTGHAKITFMNRGHAVLERIRIADFDGQGHPMATHTFLAVDANGTWAVSEANSWTQAITVTSGGFEDGSLVLHQAMRPGGGPGLLFMRKTYTPGDAEEGKAFDRFTSTLETSTDRGATWTTAVERRFTRRPASDDFFPVREDIGEPAPERVAEAGQFDFLLGEYDATNWLKQPDNELRWRSNATAVHILGGNAILEFGWVDSDPNLPDAATSILRIYNQSMRRWESLYLTNRNNRTLYFGGVREDDRIVLHPFAAQSGAGPLFQWIFFEVRENTYRWKGLQSTDRGASWDPTWTIDFVRKGTEAEG